jgi:hypothetical protein
VTRPVVATPGDAIGAWWLAGRQLGCHGPSDRPRALAPQSAAPATPRLVDARDGLVALGAMKAIDWGRGSGLIHGDHPRSRSRRAATPVARSGPRHAVEPLHAAPVIRSGRPATVVALRYVSQRQYDAYRHRQPHLRQAGGCSAGLVRLRSPAGGTGLRLSVAPAGRRPAGRSRRRDSGGVRQASAGTVACPPWPNGTRSWGDTCRMAATSAVRR